MLTTRLRITALLALLFISSTAFAESIPGRGANTGQPLGFRVKGTALTTVKGSPDLTPSLSLLPQKNGRATLAGLKTITISFNNSFTFTANIDSKGRVSGAFAAKLFNTGHLGIRFKDFDVTGVFGVSTTTNGTFTTPPIPVSITGTSDGVTPILLLSVPNFQITYVVNHGVATSIAAK